MNHLRLDSTTQGSGAQASSTQFASGVHDLVRGREQEFIEELQPLVQSQSVRLDMTSIARIDAAGIAALVVLYREAKNAGHCFAVINPSHRVARILALAGLDRILVLNDTGKILPAKQVDPIAA